MKVEMWLVNRPKPYEKNPRKNKSAIGKVVESLREFGWQQPIVVDPEGVIIVGHTRLEAAKHLQMERVPVVVAHDLTPAQVRAYRLADNRTGEEASWDKLLLSEELDALKGFEFDLAITGFDDAELRSLLAETVDESVDEIPEMPVVPTSQAGDIFQLGAHRVICGDSTDKATVDALLNGAKPHLMVTDPPYGVEYDANWRNEALAGKPRADGKVGGAARATGAVMNDGQADWREAWALFPGDVAYVWCASLQVHVVADSLSSSGFDLRASIIWAKNQFTIGRGDYHWQHEPCWYAVRNGAKGHYVGDRKQTTVWNIDKPQKSETGHSTQKPVECMKRPMENNSNRGDAVYDPFLGSGTSVIAAEITGRVCYGCELSPAYVDLIVLRWQTLSGQEAIHMDTGMTFAELALDRAGAVAQ